MRGISKATGIKAFRWQSEIGSGECCSSGFHPVWWNYQQNDKRLKSVYAFWRSLSVLTCPGFSSAGPVELWWPPEHRRGGTSSERQGGLHPDDPSFIFYSLFIIRFKVDTKSVCSLWHAYDSLMNSPPSVSWVRVDLLIVFISWLLWISCIQKSIWNRDTASRKCNLAAHLNETL